MSSVRPGATCDGVTTVYVTSTPVTVTQTLFLTETVQISAESSSTSVPSKGFALASDKANPSVQSTPDITTYITMTSTSFLTVTKFTTEDKPTSIPTVTEGPYYFLLHDGTTQFLNGKEPPTTGHFVISTHTISVVPLPVGPTSSGELQEISTSTSYSTYVMTVVMSKHDNAKAIIELPSSASVAAKSFTGYGFSGWNTSSPAFADIESAPSGFSSTQTLPSGTGPKPNYTPVPQDATSVALGADSNVTGAEVDSKIVARVVDIKSAVTSSGSTQGPFNYGGPKSRHTPIPQHAPSLDMDDLHNIVQLTDNPKIKGRQVGSVVVVTMDGAVVSWTNSYDGGSYTTTAQPSVSDYPLAAAPSTISSLGELSIQDKASELGANDHRNGCKPCCPGTRIYNDF